MPSLARLLWLSVITALATLLSVGAGGRLVAHWSYAAEKGRIQAATDELAGLHEVSKAFRLVANVARPGVVQIRVMGMESEEQLGELEERLRERFGDSLDPEALRELLRRHREGTLGSGSGIILDTAGHILSNAHVVADRGQVRVRLFDDREFEARIVGVDAKTDLAVIKIDASDLHPLRFGDSDDMEVGDWVIAVGAPFGLSFTVTHGIVSAKGRRNVEGVPILYQDFLQTDAAINPGNSGGPLLNLRGEVIGVNTAIATNGDTVNAGVAFTIPSNMAQRVAKQLKEHGEVARGWLGVQLAELTEDDRRVLQAPARLGVMVDVVYENAPAHAAGMECEDVITQVNGQTVREIRDLQRVVGEILPDQTARLTVVRDGDERTVSLTVGKQPKDFDSFSRTSRPIVSRGVGRLPLRVRTMHSGLPRVVFQGSQNEALARLASRLTGEQGVFVVETSSGDLAAGEMVVAVNGQPVESVAQMQAALRAAGNGDPVRLQVLDSAGDRRTVTVGMR